MGEAKRRSEISPDHLRKRFAYDPKTGELRWRDANRNGCDGCLAGYKHPSGYIIVEFDGVCTSAHRIIWCLMTGEWPVEVDHRNLIKDDNRWDNLRHATHAQNCLNRPLRKDNALRVKGVQKSGAGYRARITVNGKLQSLGRFETVQDAAEAYRQAASKLHGEFASW